MHVIISFSEGGGSRENWIIMLKKKSRDLGQSKAEGLSPLSTTSYVDKLFFFFNENMKSS